MYVHDIRSGITVSNTEPVILRETAATAHVDGNNVLGPVVGNFCMDLAINKSKSAGIGFVVAKGICSVVAIVINVAVLTCIKAYMIL